MPFVRVEMLAGRSGAQKREVVEVFTRELARIVACAEDDVQIIVTEIAKSDWAVGGKFPAGHAPE